MIDGTTAAGDQPGEPAVQTSIEDTSPPTHLFLDDAIGADSDGRGTGGMTRSQDAGDGEPAGADTSAG